MPLALALALALAERFADIISKEKTELSWRPIKTNYGGLVWRMVI